jgi:aryl-alcohol dehydrogenase-like predicted oxidoreductase
MQYMVLGRTGLTVSRLAFGAGPVSGLMTGDDESAQHETVLRAISLGVNWLDTAAGYGQGKSESSLGRVLQALPSETRSQVHVATKVRISLTNSESIGSQIRRGIEDSLKRLQVSRVTLLQLHNGITRSENDEPFSITPRDVLEASGVLPAFQQLQREGLVDWIGLTGTGEPESLRTVIRSGSFDTVQLPYNLLNPSAGQDMPADFTERNYGNILADCLQQRMGAFAIRVYAGGALLDQQPSAHTLTTPFFPLDLYHRDAEQARWLSQQAGAEPLQKKAVRFTLSHPAIHSAIIGFGAPEHVDEAVSGLS